MKIKLPVDAQLLSCAQEELALKKSGEHEKHYCELMTKISSNMEKSISDGFSNLMTPPQPLLLS